MKGSGKKGKPMPSKKAPPMPNMEEDTMKKAAKKPSGPKPSKKMKY